MKSHIHSLITPSVMPTYGPTPSQAHSPYHLQHATTTQMPPSHWTQSPIHHSSIFNTPSCTMAVSSMMTSPAMFELYHQNCPTLLRQPPTSWIAHHYQDLHDPTNVLHSIPIPWQTTSYTTQPPTTSNSSTPLNHITRHSSPPVTSHYHTSRPTQRPS